MEKEKEILKLMKSLGLTREEALQIIADDAKIDKGEKLFELTPEQEKASKKARGTGTRVYTFTERKRKEDVDKRKFINALSECVLAETDKMTITNPERQIDFIYNDRNFRIVLSAPRTPSK